MPARPASGTGSIGLWDNREDKIGNLLEEIVRAVMKNNDQ